DVAAFLINVEDIQITDFVESGQGRIVKNAGKARSMGAELSLTAIFTNELRLALNYGFTQAKFTDYQIKKGDVIVNDYNDKYIPFAPQNTFSANAIYNKRFQNQWIDGFSIQAQYNAAGKIYWTEENDVTQDFYGVLNLKAGITKDIWNLSFWTQNTLDTEYAAFYFESMGRNLAQRGRPFTCGVDLSVTF
ncbi:TonB-dependent receptor, partial [Bacteroidales bacterium OttesenSCG-928-A17]|nr:TonB-dependent receptor [Bacteroidales bacterium OttesenSCG-928-A17]